MSADATAAANGGANRAALLSDFCTLTGLGAPEVNNHADFAASFLDGHGWQLEPAVNAYLEMKAESAAAGGAGGVAVDEEAAAAAAVAAAADGEEHVRAPLPDKQERLFDEAPEELARRAYLHAQLLRGHLPPELAFEDVALGRGARRPAARAPVTALGGHSASSSARGHASVDPFRNYAAEVSWRPAAAASSGGGGGARKAAAGGPANLGKLFAPPDDLLFKVGGAPAGMDAAVAEALRQRKWLLVNVQQADEFASHQLNRDVWRNKAIASLVREHFVFCQLSLSTADGSRYNTLYRPAAVPTVALIDPETTQKVWDCHADALQDVDMDKTSPNVIECARRGELVVDKPFVRRLQRVLTEWADRKDLQMDHAALAHPRGASGAAAQSEEERMLQEAINASLNASSAAPSRTESASQTAAATAPVRPLAAPPVAPAATSSFHPPARSAVAASSSSAHSPAIVLDDDEDELDDHRSAVSSKDEEYIPISDSDGELEARTVRRPISMLGDEDDEGVVVAHLPGRRAAVAAPPPRAPAPAPAISAHAGDKRKFGAVDVDEGKEVATAKVSRTSSAVDPSSAAAAAAAASAAATPAAAAAAPAVAVPPEPAAGPDVCRLQIRLPAGAGKPLQRRFLKADPIKFVLAFARSQLPEAMQRNSQWTFARPCSNSVSSEIQKSTGSHVLLSCCQLLCASELLLVSVHPRRELTDEEVSHSDLCGVRVRTLSSSVFRAHTTSLLALFVCVVFVLACSSPSRHMAWSIPASSSR
jgi:hypothetical protein